MYAKHCSAESKPVGEVQVVPTTLFRNRRGSQIRLRAGDLEKGAKLCELEEANLWRLEGVDAMADGLEIQANGRYGAEDILKCGRGTSAKALEDGDR